MDKADGNIAVSLRKALVDPVCSGIGLFGHALTVSYTPREHVRVRARMDVKSIGAWALFERKQEPNLVYALYQ